MGLIGSILKLAKYVALMVLCLALIIDIPVILFLSNAKATLFESSTYSKALKESDAYSITRDAAVNKGYELLQQNAELKRFNIPKEKLQVAAKRIFTDEWLEAQTASLLSSVFSYLKGEKQTLALNVSLKELKPKIIPETRDLMDEVFEEQAEQLLQQQFQLPEGAPCKTLQECEALCKNPSYTELCEQFANQSGFETLSVQEIKNSFKKQIEANLSEQIEKIPDSIDLAEQIKNDPQAIQALEQARTGVKTIFNVINALLLFSIVLVVLIAVISFLPFHPVSAMKWVGFPLLVSGAMTAAAAYFLPSYLDQSISRQIPPELAAEQLFILAKKIFFSILGKFLQNIAFQAFILAAVGLVLFVASFFLSVMIHLIKRLIKR